MKITKLLFVCIIFITIACNNDANDLEIFTNKQQKYELHGKLINSFQIDTISIFQKKLQWISYISAQVIMKESSNRIELFNHLQGRETITLNELIGEDSNLNFKTEFLNILREHIDLSPPDRDPIHGTQSPPKPLITCEDDLGDCLFPGTVNLTEIAVQFFLQSVLEQNCIELYFPEGLSPLININLPYSITSTAHPLNHNSFNFGYHHSSTVSSRSDDNGVTETYMINTSYLDILNDNVIVARPYINETNCIYPEYLLINFHTFLQ